MPPQGLAPLPFRTETLFSIRLSDDPPPNRMPEAQLVDAVTPLTVTPVLPATRIPVFRKRWTKPSPRIVTFCSMFTKIPNSPAVCPPLQPVWGLPCPVMLYPFRSNVKPEAPKLIHGAPVTVQVTSPTRRLLSVIVSVVVIVPLISVAQATPAHPMIATVSAPQNLVIVVIPLPRVLS